MSASVTGKVELSGNGTRLAVAGYTPGFIEELGKAGYTVCGHICTEKADSAVAEPFASFETFKKFEALPTGYRALTAYRPDDLTMTMFMRCVDRWDWSRELVNSLQSYQDLYALAHAQAVWWLEACKPDLLVFSNVPHQGAMVALDAAARAMNIPVVIAMQSPFGKRFWAFRHWSELGTFPLRINSPEALDIEPPVAQPFYMKSVRSNLQNRIRASARLMRSALLYPFVSLWPGRQTKFAHRKRLLNRMARENDNLEYFRRAPQVFNQKATSLAGKRYIYFPLHLQPEMTTDILGGAYCDQLSAIEALRARLPDDVLIAVKENPKQRGFARSEVFFKRLQSLSGIVCIDVREPSFELTSKAMAVATITGTAGWEALRMGKPAICFGDAFWNRLPGAFRIQDDWGWDDLVGFAFDKETLANAMEDISRALLQGYSDHLYASTDMEFNETYNSLLQVQQLSRVFDTVLKEHNETCH